MNVYKPSALYRPKGDIMYTVRVRCFMDEKFMNHLKSMILRNCGTLAAFARVVDITPQALSNWLERGIPGSRLFEVADALNVEPAELRPFTSEGRRPLPAPDAEIRRFKVLFARLDPDRQQAVLEELRKALEKK